MKLQHQNDRQARMDAFKTIPDDETEYVRQRAEEESALTDELYEQLFGNTFLTVPEEYLPTEEDLEAMFREWSDSGW